MSATTSNSPEARPQSPSLYEKLEDGEIPCVKHPLHYMMSLNEVVLGSVLEEYRNCTICQEPYETGEFPESILILPCKHMFGSSCLRNWLVDAEKQTCPCCRAQLYHLEPVRPCVCDGVRYIDEDDADYQRYTEMSLDYDDQDDDDYDEQDQPTPEVRDLLNSGTLDDITRVVGIITNLTSELETWDVIPFGHPYTSRQLRGLFWELRDRDFELPESYIKGFAALIPRLYYRLQDMLELMGEPIDEMERALAWAGGYIPLDQVLNSRFQYSIELALDQLDSAELSLRLTDFTHAEEELGHSGLGWLRSLG